MRWIGYRAACSAPRLGADVPAASGEAELALRVDHLAQTRAEAIDTGAAEMRRIERDLHDGAQARMVAIGMTLYAAEQLLEDNPAAYSEAHPRRLFAFRTCSNMP